MSDEPVKRKRGRPVGWKKPVGQVTPLGRPRYRPSAEQKELVAHLLAVGEAHKDIAHLLGISEPLFSKRYAAQITDARLSLRARFCAVVFAKALEGNASMVKLAMDLTAAPDAADVPYQLPQAAPIEAAPKEPKLGKKERQALDAANPDTSTPMGRLMAERAKRGDRVQ